MDALIRALVTAIHNSPFRLVLVTAGAGTKALSDLLGVAGASRTLLEAIVPYNEASFNDFLGQTPEQYVSEKTARLLAGRALTRARWLHGEDHPTIGLACTATIITDRPKRGEHRAYIASWHAEQRVTQFVHLHKGVRNREGEEQIVSDLLLNLLAQEVGLQQQIAIDWAADDTLTTQVVEFALHAGAVLSGEQSFFGITEDGRIQHTLTHPAILCGSFNPLHEGHLALAQVAGEMLGQPVAFECAAINVDKPPLDVATILNRMAQFAGRWNIYTSTAPTFVEKSKLFPHTSFVVGHDTAVRIVTPRYYQNSTAYMNASLTQIQQNGCRFLVAGRVDEYGRFRDLTDINIPPPFQTLFQPIPRDLFRKDISSTQLRKKGARGSR